MRQLNSGWVKALQTKVSGIVAVGEHPAKWILDRYGPGDDTHGRRMELRQNLKAFLGDDELPDFNVTIPHGDAGPEGPVIVPLDASS